VFRIAGLTKKQALPYFMVGPLLLKRQEEQVMYKKSIKFAGYALIAVLYADGTNAMAASTDVDIHSRPATPPSFGLDHKAIDPTFGSTILRVTGPAGSNAYNEADNLENLAPIQHFTGPWNKDSNRFIVWWDRTYKIGNASRIRQYSFDGSTFAIAGYKDMKGYDGVSAGGTQNAYLNINRYITYSPTVSELVYGLALPNNDKIATYNFATETGAALSPQPSWLTVFGGYDLDALMVSDDENVFGFTVTSAVQVSKCYVVWVKSINAYATIDLTAATGGWVGTIPKPSSVFMSRDGKFIRVAGQRAGDSNSMQYIYTVENNGTNVTINGPTAYSGYSPDYFAGKMSYYKNYGVSEDSQGDGGFGYQLKYRDLKNIKGTMTRILATPNQMFCHPAVSQGGGYVACGLIAYAPLSLYGSDAWVLATGKVYSRAITGNSVPTDFDYLIYDQINMKKVATMAAITGPGMYWYDTTLKKLYAWITGGSAPVDYKAYGGAWKLYSDELLVTDVRNDIATGGSPQYPYKRLAHLWSNFRDNAWDEVPTALSWDNKYVLFYSNWNGSGRHDVFIVKTDINASTGPRSPKNLMKK